MDSQDNQHPIPPSDTSIALRTPIVDQHWTGHPVTLDALFDHLPVGLAIFDVSNAFRCIRHNRQFLQLVGHVWQERGSIAGVPLRDLVAAESYQAIRAMFERVRVSGEVLAIDQAAAVAPLDYAPSYDMWKLIPLKDRDGRVIAILVSAGEQTERKRAEIAQAQLAAIVESSDDAIIGKSLDGIIESWNAGAERLYGYTAGEMIGRSITTLAPPDRVDEVLQILDRMRQGERVEHFETVRVRKDGTQITVSLTVSPIKDVQGIVTGASAIARDMTERVQAYQLLERRVEERTRELSTLLTIANTVASTLDQQPLLELVLIQLQAIVPYTGAAIAIRQGDELVIQEYRGTLVHDQIVGVRVPLRQDVPLMDAVRRGEPLIIDDVQADTPAARTLQILMHLYLHRPFSAVRSAMGVPLLSKERVIGMIGLAHHTSHYYTPALARLALAVARQAAVAIENAHLYEQAQALAALEERQRLSRELHDAVTQMLFSASLIAEVLPRLWEQNPAEGRQSLEDLRHLTRGALAEMRMLLLELRPAALVEAELGELLRQLADAITGRTRLPIAVTVDGQVSIPPDAQMALYRVAQEALNNVAKHAHAHQASVYLHATVEGVELRIRDDGIGFDSVRTAFDHFGLRIMRERVAAIGATLQIASQPGQGTEVRVSWRNEHMRNSL